MVATLAEDTYFVGWYLELYQGDTAIIKYEVRDIDNFYLFKDVAHFIKGLKAFCPDPTTVTAVRGDGYDE